jgi:hypothetical protein
VTDAVRDDGKGGAELPRAQKHVKPLVGNRSAKIMFRTPRGSTR